MRRCYELGVYPDYWKILPVADQGTWQAIEALIGEYDPYCRGILFLGLNVAEAELVKRFAALPESPRALRFAIGRSIFLEPARKWFAGQMSDEDAVATCGITSCGWPRVEQAQPRVVFSGAARPRTLGRALPPHSARASAPTQRGVSCCKAAGSAGRGIALFIRNTDKQNLLHPNPGVPHSPCWDARTKAL